MSNRLTQQQRDIFIEAIMLDVPQIDFEEEREKLVREEAVEAILPSLQRAYKDHPDWFATTQVYSRETGYVYFPLAAWLEVPAHIMKKAEELKKRETAQESARRELRNKLKVRVKSIITLGGLEKAFPEFKKYIPSKPAVGNPDRSLPVADAQIVAEAVKMGWPKGKKE
jgi:hypothetical protein